MIFIRMITKKNYCDNFHSSSRSNTPREQRRDLQSPPFLLGGLPWGELVLIIMIIPSLSLIPDLSNLIIKLRVGDDHGVGHLDDIGPGDNNCEHGVTVIAIVTIT